MAEQIDILSPDGVLGTIDPSEVDNALAQGFKLPQEADFIKSENREVADSTAGKIAAFAGSALNTASFGALESGLKNYAPRYAEALNTAQEVNPVSSGVGTAAGIGASFLNPAMGLVSKAGQAVGAGTKAALGVSKVADVASKASKSSKVAQFGANVASKVAQFGAEGALVSLPATSIEASVGNYDQAVENLLLGSGVGAGVGLGAGILPTFLKAAGKTVDAAGSVVQPAGSYLAKSAKAFEMNQGGKILGFTKGIRNNLNKLNANRADELVEFAEKKGLMKLFGSTDDVNKLVADLSQKEGQAIGGVIKSVDDTGLLFSDAKVLMQKLDEIEVSDMSIKSAKTRAFQRGYNDVKKLTTDANGNARNPTLQELQKYKKEFADESYVKFGEVKPGAEYYQKIERVLDDHIDYSLQQAESAMGANFAKEWRTAKQEYHNFKDLVKPLKDKLASEYGNQFIKPSDFAGAGVGGLTGGVTGAVGGYVLNSLRQRYGAQLAYKAVKSINRSIELRQASIDGAVNSFLGVSSKVPRALGNEAVAPSSLGILSNFVNEKQASRIKNLEKFNEELSSELINPTQLQEKMAELTQGLAQADTELGAGIYGKLLETTKYLQEKAPKGTQIPTALNPSKFTPSDRDISSYERRVRAATNPYSLLIDLNKGQISPEAVETVKDLYPTFYSQITRSILENGTASKKPLPYVKRLQVSTLLGTQLDGLSNKQNQQALQANFAIEQQQQQQQAKGINSQMPSSIQTDVQRISSK